MRKHLVRQQMQHQTYPSHLKTTLMPQGGIDEFRLHRKPPIFPLPI